jgi:hypothetical protein
MDNVLTRFRERLAGFPVCNGILQEKQSAIPDDGVRASEALTDYSPQKSQYIETILSIERMPESIRFCITERDMTPDSSSPGSQTTDIVFQLYLVYGSPTFSLDNEDRPVGELDDAIELLVEAIA